MLNLNNTATALKQIHTLHAILYKACFKYPVTYSLTHSYLNDVTVKIWHNEANTAKAKPAYTFIVRICNPHAIPYFAVELKYVLVSFGVSK